jgi:hypothetical protein
MRLSSKDILLMFGIIVAIVVTITTIAYGEQGAAHLPRVDSPMKRASIQKTAVDFFKSALDRSTHR